MVGTILSLWDAAELDAAGDDGEVVPSFINLADASIKMVRERERHTHTSYVYWIWLIPYRSNPYP